MKIKVTQEHIDDGAPNDEYACPIALALREVFPDTFIEVDGKTLVIGNKQCNSPNELNSFIEKFDSDQDVEPFEFELDVDNMKPIPSEARLVIHDYNEE